MHGTGPCLIDGCTTHSARTRVTDFTWKAIMEFEDLHESECPTPTLARFEGKDGIYSPKARFFNLIGCVAVGCS